MILKVMQMSICMKVMREEVKRLRRQPGVPEEEGPALGQNTWWPREGKGRDTVRASYS